MMIRKFIRLWIRLGVAKTNGMKYIQPVLMERRNWLFSIGTTACLFLSIGNLNAGPKDKIPLTAMDSVHFKAFFETNDLLEFDLRTNFVELLTDIGKKRNYHSSQLSYRNALGEDVNMVVKVKTRGKFRRRKENCDFPPLKFNFSNKQTLGSTFAGQDKLKFVSHCQNFVDEYEQHTLEEYLIYRMYNLVSDNSFKVRLSRVTYVDTNGTDTLKRFGFFVEDRKQMAERCGKNILDYKNVKQFDVLRKSMVHLCLFQLMIGNSDWSVDRLHNIYLISVDENSIPVAVPYDFDWSALIGHSYYVPDPNIAPDAKYQRKYKGYHWSKEEMEPAIEFYQSIKNELFQLVNDFPYLHQSNKNKFVEYISEFYEIIGSKRNVKNFLLKGSPKVPN